VGSRKTEKFDSAYGSTQDDRVVVRRSNPYGQHAKGCFFLLSKFTENTKNLPNYPGFADA